MAQKIINYVKEKAGFDVIKIQNVITCFTTILLFIVMVIHRNEGRLIELKEFLTEESIFLRGSQILFSVLMLINSVLFIRYSIKYLTTKWVKRRDVSLFPTLVLQWDVFVIICIAQIILQILFLLISPVFNTAYGMILLDSIIISVLITFAEWCLTFKINPLDNTALAEYRKDKPYIAELLDIITDDSIKKRIAHQLYTYAYKARWYKKMYYVLSFISIAASAFTVAINSFPEDVIGDWRSVLTMISVLTALATGALNTVKVKETWVRNREYCEKTKAFIYKSIKDFPKHMTSEERLAKEKEMAENLEEFFEEECGQWKITRSS